MIRPASIAREGARPPAPAGGSAGYRPDIDGLRAVAVLAVVAFHAFPASMPGGFVGVDIFFVISGFLISTLLYESLDTGPLRLTAFYGRRVRRLFPALALVLACCYAFGWTALLDEEFRQLGRHLAAGALFTSNLTLWRDVGYFDAAADTKPLLHLWSLSIEEQFYLLFPWVLVLARRRGYPLWPVLAVAAAASFVLCLVSQRTDPAGAFYSPLTRFWELLAGAMLALGVRRGLDAGRWSDLAGLTGILLLAAGCLGLSRTLAFPGPWALLPVCGTLLVIAAGPGAWVNRRLLASRPAVLVGLISYPLYLWHWPVLAFARIVEGGTPGAAFRLLAVAACAGLAWLTWRFVERPLRTGAHPGWKVGTLAAAVACIGYLGYDAAERAGRPDRPIVRHNAVWQSGFDGGDQGRMVGRCAIRDEAIRTRFKHCLEDERGGVRFALVGDSKAEALYGGLVRTSSPAGRWTFIGGTSAQGAPVPMLASDRDPGRPLTVQALEAVAGSAQIEAVVLVAGIRSLFGIDEMIRDEGAERYDPGYLSRLDSGSDPARVADQLARAVATLVTRGKRVYLLVDHPALPHPADCIERRTGSEFLNRFVGRPDAACQPPLDRFRREIVPYLGVLEAVRARHPESVTVIDATDLYCDQGAGICPAFRDGRRLYSVTDHLSDYAAGLVGRRINALLTR